MTTARLRYSRDEILTDPDYATRIERNGVLLHGGYAADGTYLPPRSVHRVPAIAAWGVRQGDVDSELERYREDIARESGRNVNV